MSSSNDEAPVGPETKWLSDVAARIREALDLAGKTKRKFSGSDRQFKPEHVARGIGEPHVLPFYDWLNGRAEPSHAQLTRIAEWCGVDVRWMTLGDGRPYPIIDDPDPTNPIKAALYLLGVDSRTSDLSDVALSFVRCIDDGSVAVIRQRGHKAEIIKTLIKINNFADLHWGNSLFEFSKALRILYGRRGADGYCGSEKFELKGIMLEQGPFERLLQGRTNPDELFCNAEAESPWPNLVWQEPSPHDPELPRFSREFSDIRRQLVANMAASPVKQKANLNLVISTPVYRWHLLEDLEL